MSISPLNQRRIANFKANKRGYYSLWLFLILFVFSLFAEFWANDKPLLVSYNNTWYYPLLNRLSVHSSISLIFLSFSPSSIFSFCSSLKLIQLKHQLSKTEKLMQPLQVLTTLPISEPKSIGFDFIKKYPPLKNGLIVGLIMDLMSFPI